MMLSPLNVGLIGVIAILTVVVFLQDKALAVLKVEKRHETDRANGLEIEKNAAEQKIKNKDAHISALCDLIRDAINKIKDNARLAKLAVSLLQDSDSENVILQAEIEKKATSAEELEHMLDMMAKAAQNGQRGRNVPPA
jgi:hypothetical protein